MKKIAVCSLLIISLCSCSSNGESQSNDELTQQLKNDIEAVNSTQETVEEKMQAPIDEEKAKSLCERHLALKGRRWGDPTKVSEDEDWFYVSYETPKQELRLIGDRTLKVDKETGVVSWRKRR